MPQKKAISTRFRQLQSDIIQGLETLDGKSKFRVDSWDRPGGGGGSARVIENGDLIVKGGVNFSEVHGQLPEMMQVALKATSDAQFYATGVSIVLHPHSPMVPIIHMNVRYFEMQDGDRQDYWFGGGIDLTPHYIDKELAKSFHQKLKATCDSFDEGYYPKFKNWADDYFYIPHRKETRGIGGIFFDHMKEDDQHDKQHRFDFVVAVGETFVPTYVQQAKATRALPYTQKEIDWQMLRRGRYVEFNLVHDRGTKFGLETNGRTESILMSLPPLAGWEYNHTPEAGSKEARTLALLKKGLDPKAFG